MASTKSKQDALIDELLQDCPDPKDILGKNTGRSSNLPSGWSNEP